VWERRVKLHPVVSKRRDCREVLPGVSYSVRLSSPLWVTEKGCCVAEADNQGNTVMSNENDETGSGGRETMTALNRAATELEACGRGIRRSVDAILRSCNTPGTKAAAHRDLLVEKVAELRHLSALCSSSAARLNDCRCRLNCDGSRDEVLKELLGVSQSLGDQLRSEQRDALRTLRLLDPEQPGPRSPVA